MSCAATAMNGENGVFPRRSRRSIVDECPSVGYLLRVREYIEKIGWQISAKQLLEVLESARGGVEAEHTLVTDAWGGQPITTFTEVLESDAQGRGVSCWPLATRAMVEKLVQISLGYTHCCEIFQQDIEMALREGRAIKQGPVLELLAKMDKMAVFLHRWLPPLRVARKALDDPVPVSERSSMGGILVPGCIGKDMEMLDEESEFEEEWMSWSDDDFSDPANVPIILGPSPPEKPERHPYEVMADKWKAKALKALDFSVDVLETAAVASGFICAHGPKYRSLTNTYWQEAVRDKPSLWLQVLNVAWRDCQEVEVASSTHPDDLDLQIGYWNFRGIGAPMRMMCDYAGVKWENIPYEVREKRPGHWVCHEWDKDDKIILSRDNPFVQLPYVKNKATGEVVSQSNAVCLYLGRLLSLNGSTPQEQLANEQVLFYVYQMWQETTDLVYPFKQNKDMEAFQKSLNNHLRHVIPAHYRKLESWLTLVGSNFFVGQESPCTADFQVWEVIDQHEQMALKHSFKSPTSSFPQLEAFHSLLQHEPRLQKYFDSDFYKLPCNNKMAFFQ
jgi:glutathione S-transferase